MKSKNEVLFKSGWTEQDFDAFWFACYLDYPYFAKHVLGFDVADFHKEWFHLCQKYKRLCILAHRGSGKTFWFAGYFIWLSCFNFDKEFLVVSHNLEHAKYILKVIKSMISQNDILKQLMPRDKEVSWRQTEITTSTNCTFYMRTYSEGIRGIHPDYCFADEGGKYEDKNIFWQVIIPTLNLKVGRCIVAGTPVSFGDLLMELLNENEEFFAKKYPAVIEINGKKQPLWDAKYTMQIHDIFGKASLPKIKREIGSVNFEQEFMLNPVSSQTSLFPYELINENIDPNSSFLEFSEVNKRYVIGMDIAYSKKLRGDFNVILVMEIDSERNKRIVFMERFKGSEQEEILKNVINRFHPYRVVIDEQGVGYGFVEDLQKKLTSVNIEGFSLNSPEKKNDLLKNLRTEMENNRISIPHSPNCPKTYTLISVLIKELEETGWIIKGGKAKITGLGKHDDTVTAFALANYASEQSIGKVGIDFI